MIVADTNFVVYFLIPSSFTLEAEAVRSRDSRWIAPPIFKYELMNVLATHVRQGLLTRDGAIKKYRRAMSMVQISGFEPSAIDVLGAAIATNCSTYDIEFVMVANELGVPLVTRDKQMLKSFTDIAVDFAGFLLLR